MPAPYNLTKINNATNPIDLASGLNQQSGGLLGISLLVMLFVISIANLLIRGYPFRESYAASSFFTFILALILWSFQEVFSVPMISDYILFITVLMLLGGLLGLLIRN